MKKNLFFCLLLTIMLAAITPLPAQDHGDILLQLRFYEGARGTKPAAAQVVTSYTLRPLFVGNFITRKDLQEEETELKRIFNLKELAVLIQTQWSWERDKAEKHFQMVVLNGHEFLLQVTKLPAVDAFRVQVLDRDTKEKPALLDSEIELPAGKASVFGFEDSLAQPYFLALQRQADAVPGMETALQPTPVPQTAPLTKFIRMVEPVYPEKMVQSGLTASVTLQAKVDEQGKVSDVQALSDENEFVKAAVTAIKQWQVAPLVVDGKARPQTFTCTVSFLGDIVCLNFAKEPPRSAFQAIWPARGYITGIFGKRRNPFTKKDEFHTGIDIAAKAGTPVLSTAAGTVTISEFNDQDGNLIVIDHGNGYTSRYTHLDSSRVRKGDSVAQGQQIGILGTTGISTGPHLHFEIRYNDRPRNPFKFIDPAS